MKKSTKQKIITVITRRRLMHTQAVAKAVGCSDNTAWVTLRRIENDGLVESERVGQHTFWNIKK